MWEGCKVLNEEIDILTVFTALFVSPFLFSFVIFAPLRERLPAKNPLRIICDIYGIVGFRASSGPTRRMT